MKNISEYIQHWADTYKNDMQNNIMPFWMEHGLDTVNGGLYTCVDREGTLMFGFRDVLLLLVLMPIIISKRTRHGCMQPKARLTL